MALELTTNFATSTVATAPSPATSGTSLVVAAGHGARFPAGAQDFNAVVCPADAQPTPANAEIVRVTSISTDTFTITRAQESTSARTIVVGDRIYAGITAKTLADINSDISTINLDLTLGVIRNSFMNAKGDLIAGAADDTTARVTVGSNFQVLQANSGATPGVSWTSNFDRDQGVAGMVTPVAPYLGTASTALTASRAYFARVQPSRTITVASVVFIVATAAGAADAFDVGVYTVSGANLARQASVGAITSATSGGGLSTTGVKVVNLSTTLTAGTVYYIGFSVGTFGGTAGNLVMAQGTFNGAFDLIGTAAGTSFGLFKATSHPLPDPVTSPSSGAAQVPVLALRE